ncbi:MAG: hypothetical protein CL878_13565 [Dehalococcoidia bacterium]|nr:hypothetical protein [Dehalococcoidia bacterium]
MVSRRLKLTEYQTKHRVRLSAEEARLLRRSEWSISVVPSSDEDGTYDVTPAARVGMIELGSLTIEIHPKLPLDRLLFLLSYTLDPKLWQRTLSHFIAADSIVEAVIPAFVALCSAALRKGVLQGYRHEEDMLSNVRGRVRFQEQLSGASLK